MKDKKEEKKAVEPITQKEKLALSEERAKKAKELGFPSTFAYLNSLNAGVPPRKEDYTKVTPLRRAKK